MRVLDGARSSVGGYRRRFATIVNSPWMRAARKAFCLRPPFRFVGSQARFNTHLGPTMKDDPRLIFNTLADDTLLSIGDAAKVLRVGESTTWRYLAHDANLQATCVRLGKLTRIPAGALRRFIASKVGQPAKSPAVLEQAQTAAHALRRAHPNAGVAARERAAVAARKAPTKKAPTRRKAVA